MLCVSERRAHQQGVQKCSEEQVRIGVSAYHSATDSQTQDRPVTGCTSKHGKVKGVKNQDIPCKQGKSDKAGTKILAHTNKLITHTTSKTHKGQFNNSKLVTPSPRTENTTTGTQVTQKHAHPKDENTRKHINQRRKQKRSNKKRKHNKSCSSDTDITTVIDVPCIDRSQTDISLQGSIVHVHIEGTKVPALIDTGAVKASCMSHSLYKRLGLGNIAQLKQSSISSVRGVGGTLIPIVGEANIPLRVGDLCTNHKFFILQTMNYQVILGMDFLEQHVSQIDIERKKLVLKNANNPINIFQVPDMYVAQLMYSVNIPPGAETVVPVDVRQMKGLDQDQVVLTPTDSLAWKKEYSRCMYSSSH